MAIKYEDKTIKFEAVVYEDEVLTLREKLTELAPEKLNFDMLSCDDIHLSVLQQVLAYKKLYECEFSFMEDKKMYQKIIEGFDIKDCTV
jgi:hypothetical protein